MALAAQFERFADLAAVCCSAASAAHFSRLADAARQSAAAFVQQCGGGFLPSVAQRYARLQLTMQERRADGQLRAEAVRGARAARRAHQQRQQRHEARAGPPKRRARSQ